MLRFFAIMTSYGEVSEWFKEPVLKTGDAAMHRGFESHSLRHSVSHKEHGSLMIKLDSGLAQVTTQYAEVLKLVTRRPC